MTLNIDTAPYEAHQLVVRTFEQMPAKIIQDGPSHVVARTRLNWQSWGEVLSADLQPSGAATAVVIQSRPRLQTTIADYGRNQDNITRITDALQRSDPSSPRAETR